MKKSVIKFFDKIIIVLLGFSGLLCSCDKYNTDMYGMPPDQPVYGMPYETYELKGVITDKETSKPIQNIQIVQYGDTIYTDTEGKYILYNLSSEFQLKIEDIDGEQNGGDFMSKEIDVLFTQEDKIERDKFVKTLNIELDKNIE